MEQFEQPFGKDSPDYFEVQFPEADIFRDYEMHVLQLGIQMAPLRHYINAKKDFDKLQTEINSLMEGRQPHSKGYGFQQEQIEEKLKLFQRYAAMIDDAEKNGAPEEVLADTKQKLQELKERQQELKDIISVGKNNPELN